MLKQIKFAIKYAYAFFAAAYLFLLGFLFARNRDLITSIAVHFGYARKRRKSIQPLLPEVVYSELITSVQPLRILEPIHQRGNVSLFEMWIIDHLVKQVDARQIFEFGTFDGRTTLNMAANSCESAKVYTIDLPREQMNATQLALDSDEKILIDKESSGERFHGYPEEKKIVQLYGDTATFDFKPYFDSSDFIFIDASHSYEYVLNDTLIALKLLKSGKGIILWHDYDSAFDGVTKALNELLAGNELLKDVKHILDTSLAILLRK
ncbi:MAG: hypothetical protein A2036_01390 [Omnitrophica bacterium GWA2_50_21]|nr:MAG: hypothetical protein A2036_01390 [Omnitrophica bacterium GWA2_50_21]